MTNAWDDVVAERLRQINEEGWSTGHDDEHREEEMADAAACYAMSTSDYSIISQLWPWDWKWWKPKDRRRDLVRAAALLLAEIERLDRMK